MTALDELTITIGQHKPHTEESWKAEAKKHLQTLGVAKPDAKVQSDDLYQDYVVEGGFTDQSFRDDPVGAVMDQRAYLNSGLDAGPQD